MFNLKNKTLIALLGVSFFLAGCGSEESGGSQGRNGMSRGGMNGRGGDARNAAIPVQVAEVRRGDISTFLLHTTTIEAEKQVDVLAKVAGQVKRLAVEEGDRVRTGSRLVTLEETEYQIEFMQAKTRMETDKAIFERSQNMLEKQLIAEETHETTRMQYESSKSAFDAAKLKVDHLNVTSPVTGVVTLRHIELGQRVNTNEVMFSVADLDPLRAKIYVPEKDMGELFEGQKALISVDALPDKEFEGHVKMISPIVDPTNGTVKVTIDIPGAEKELKPGMFASVFITTESHENTLLLPKKALLLESETDQVYVFDNGVAKKRMLEVGFVSGDTIEALSGLEEGDVVVTVGQDGLREGLAIRVPGQDAPAQQVAQKMPERGERLADGGEKKADKDKPAVEEKVDMELLKRLEARMEESRFMKRGYDRSLEQDPEIATDPAKKMAFFRRYVDETANRIFGFNPEAAQAWQKKIEEDPDFENNIEKQLDFFAELMKNFRRGGGGRRGGPGA